jgi:hypothetical protein
LTELFALFVWGSSLRRLPFSNLKSESRRRIVWRNCACLRRLFADMNVLGTDGAPRWTADNE